MSLFFPKNFLTVCLAVLTLFLSGCFSSGEDEGSKLASEPATSDKAEGEAPGEVKENDQPESEEISGVNEVKSQDPGDWKQFFKAPPTTGQRSVLLRSVQEAPGDSKDSRLAYARKQMALGHLDEAEKAYRQVMRDDPSHLPAALEMSMIMIRKDKASEAFTILEEIRYQFSKKKESSTGFIFQYRYTLALAFLLINDRSKCHEILTDLIETDKTFAPGYAALASSYLASGKTGVAEFVVQRGMERSKEDASLYNLMGVIEQKKGLFDKADYWYKKALDLRPEFAAALTNQAVLAIQRYEFDAAGLLLKKSIALQPSFAESHIALGVVYMHQQKTDDARTVLNRVLESYPRNAFARYNLGVLTLYGFNKPFEAMQLFQEAVQTSGVGDEEVRWSAENYISDIRHSGQVR